ncbi:MAG: 4-(cytidine 5'-diphospho)-2-C-methyl-D-erythritol kinase [Xanthobacteraceae bacterium]|nr:4-(cytidine 5'-diphospho)-2-C-methyl-D-erythritol kinase [Xanthobacteraceae bacterium]
MRATSSPTTTSSRPSRRSSRTGFRPRRQTRPRSRATAAEDVAPSLAALAPAKVNLTLRILGRRADGYHELESLVVFAGCGDHLTFDPGPRLDLTVSGPTAGQSGAIADNLVLRAAKALAEEVPSVTVGRFALTKELPAGAGLGGGSADAAAALRLLAEANGLARDDPRVVAAARATGADVSVCLDPRPRVMRGIGDILSVPLPLPELGIVIVHPGIAMPTPPVFKALGLSPGERCTAGEPSGPVPEQREALLTWLAGERNDLEPPAIGIAPEIEEVIRALAVLPGCRLARMSGSGSACFGLFDTAAAAAAAARRLAKAHPAWWARAAIIGG